MNWLKYPDNHPIDGSFVLGYYRMVHDSYSLAIFYYHEGYFHESGIDEEASSKDIKYFIQIPELPEELR